MGIIHPCTNSQVSQILFNLVDILDSTIVASPESHVLIESPTVPDAPEQIEGSRTASTDVELSASLAIARAYSDSAAYKNKAHDKTLPRSSLTARQKTQKSTLPPLVALPENPVPNYTLDEDSYQRATLEKSKIGSEKVKVRFSEPESEVGKEEAVQAAGLQKSAKLTPVSKDMIESMGRQLTPADSDYQKIVCGLPCNNPRREKELNYTLAVLTGLRNTKGEEKKSKSPAKKGFTKRKIL
jgi:hypothetical protein